MPIDGGKGGIAALCSDCIDDVSVTSVKRENAMCYTRVNSKPAARMLATTLTEIATAGCDPLGAGAGAGEAAGDAAGVDAGLVLAEVLGAVGSTTASAVFAGQRNGKREQTAGRAGRAR